MKSALGVVAAALVAVTVLLAVLLWRVDRLETRMPEDPEPALSGQTVFTDDGQGYVGTERYMGESIGDWHGRHAEKVGVY